MFTCEISHKHLWYDSISTSALRGIGVVFSCIVNYIIKVERFECTSLLHASYGGTDICTFPLTASYTYGNTL